ASNFELGAGTNSNPPTWGLTPFLGDQSYSVDGLSSICWFPAPSSPRQTQCPPRKSTIRMGITSSGGKLKQNGRHQIDKAGQAAVSADVNNGKVTGHVG